MAILTTEATTLANSQTQVEAAEVAAQNELRPSGQLRSSLEVKGYHLKAVDGEK